MKALAFGEILWDIFPEKQVIGGAPFNFAAHLVKNGSEAYLVSAVGRDDLTDKTLKEVEKSSVKSDYITCIDKETGKCLVTLDENSIPSYNLLNDVAYDYISIDDVALESFDLLYFGTLSLRSPHNTRQVQRLTDSGAFKEIFVDVNIRKPFSSEESVAFAVSKATVLKISDEELPFVTKAVFNEELDFEEAARKFSRNYPNLKLIIITLGAQGSYAYSCAEGKGYAKSGRRVKAVSTVGAGDSYSAAFMASFMKTGDIEQALESATKVSAFVVTKTEAIPDYDPEKL